MLRVFKYESLVGYGLLLLVCIGLSVNLYLNIDILHLTTNSTNLVSEGIQDLIGQAFGKYDLGNYGMLGLFIAFFVLLAIVTNQLVNRIGLSNQPSLITAFTFILLGSWFNSSIFLTPVFIGFIGVVFATHRMYASLLREKFTDVFDIGFFIGVATLIHPPYILLVLFFTFFLLMNHAASWKKWLLFFLGLTLPFYFLGIYWLFTEDAFLDFFQNWLPQISFDTFQTLSDPKILFKLGTLFLMGITFAYFSQASNVELGIRRLLRWTIGLWGMLIPIGLLFGSGIEEGLFMWILPLSLFFGVFALSYEKILIPEIISISLLIVVLLFQFF